MSEQKKPGKKQTRRPYYAEGELRDKSIEEKMDPNFGRENLGNLIRKAAKKS